MKPRKTILKILVVDDERPARANIVAMLRQETDVGDIWQARGGQEAVKLIRENEPDVVFLDVMMPKMNGFEVIRTIGPENMPEVIFVTAYDRYAMKAFDSEAVDYLLKPVSDSRFQRALQRVRKRLTAGARSRADARLAAVVYPEANLSGTLRNGVIERFNVRLGNKSIYVPIEDVEWIESASYYVKLHIGKRVFVVRQAIRELEKHLAKRGFLRVHRSAMINRAFLSEIRKVKNGTAVAVTKEGQEIPISRRRVRQTKLALRDTRWSI